MRRPDHTPPRDARAQAHCVIAVFESIILQGLLAPARTPDTLLSRLNQEIVQVLHRADVKERHFSSGVETVGSSPADLAATIRSDIAKWGRVFEEAGIRVD